ncbi:hypothetical protein [Micromonospora zamorensis]|uniref:Recombinase XerD n=1 Tax=Micromonospora zamorensis TaxID=709883 RepID=A0ABZ1PN19_9ACTN
MTAPPAEPAPVPCRRCGVIPPGWRGRHPVCERCKIELRLQRLLGDDAGRIRHELAPFVTMLRDDPRGATTRMWLYNPRAVELLTALGSGRLELSHSALTSWPHATAARYLRHRLIACGLLPPVDRYLVDTEVWLHRRLAQLVEHPHERVLRQFALWHQLLRLRSTAAIRPLRSTAKFYVTEQFTQAQHFLTWLHEHDIDPAALAQAQLDTWYASHRVHQRHRVRGFLLWAADARHLPRGLIAHRVAFKPGAAITQQRRLALLRRFVTDNTGPLPTRVAACLLLLYAQPISRIHRLTTTDLLDDGPELLIRFGAPPVPVPEPSAGLLRELAAAARYTEPGWLFPGRYAGQSLAYPTAAKRLRTLGIPLKEARVSALRQLVLQAPAPVVADALGFHQTSTARQVANAGGTWSRYAPARSSRAG